jgi:hypothetical protein
MNVKQTTPYSLQLCNIIHQTQTTVYKLSLEPIHQSFRPNHFFGSAKIKILVSSGPGGYDVAGGTSSG